MSRPYLVAGVTIAVALTLASCRGDDDTADSTPESSVTDSTADSTPGSTGSSTTEASTETTTSTTTATTTTGSTGTTTDASDPATTTLVVTTTTSASTAGSTTASTVTATTGVAAATSTVAPTTGSTDWLAPTGDYTVDFPAEPMMFELPPPVETAETPVPLYAVETDDYGLLTSRTDYADYGVDASAIDVEGARDFAVESAAGELTDSQDVTVQGRDGVRFQFVIGEPQPGVGDGMLLLDGTVLYQVIGIGVVAESDFFTAFVDSFAFVEDR